MARAIEKGYAPFRDLAARMDAKELTVSKSESGYIILAPKAVRLVDFKCLPDTVDPRSPKGSK
jgi:hypothetical protein